MNNRFVKNILLVAVISFLFFCLIKIVRNMILYNSMEINETERFFGHVQENCSYLEK